MAMLNNQMVVIVPTYSNLPYVVAPNMAALGDLFVKTGWLWLQLLGIGSRKYHQFDSMIIQYIHIHIIYTYSMYIYIYVYKYIYVDAQ